MLQHWNRASELSPIDYPLPSSRTDKVDELLRLCRSIDRKLTRLMAHNESRYTYISL